MHGLPGSDAKWGGRWESNLLGRRLRAFETGGLARMPNPDGSGGATFLDPFTSLIAEGGR
jgi:hypothetical protein